MAQQSPPTAPIRAGRAVKLVAGLAAASVGAGVLAAGLLVPAVAAAGSVATSTVDLFDSLPADLEEQPLSQQSRILYADGSLMATFYYENRTVVPLDAVSPVMQQAVIAIEDSRFYEHGGVDPRGMGRAFVQNLQEDDVQGASTLTQQWIKNVQVEEALAALPANATEEERAAAFASTTQRSGLEGYTRKLREVKLAIAAEKQLSKDEILERYLNIANFAGGQYGVEAASKHWFNKSARDLSLADAALLAGIVQNPTGYDPVNNPENALARRNTVLARMLELGVVDQAQHDEAAALPLEAQLNVQQTPNGCVQAGASGFFCDYVVETLLNDPTFGDDRSARSRLLYRGGLTVTTTLDPVKQQAAVEEVNGFVPDDGSGIASTLVSVEPGTGYIKAMAQNRSYDPRSESTTGGTSINYNADFAMGGSEGFQPGSNFKPFVLATWLASGRQLNDTVDSPSKRVWPTRSFKTGACMGNSLEPLDKPWTVNNAGDGPASGGRISVLGATYASVNTAYSAIENQLQLCDVRATAEALGVKKALANKRNPERELSTRLEVNPSMVLGTINVAPLDIASAFAAFAAQGTYCAPRAISAVTDPAGGALPVPATDCRQAISPEVANGVTYALKETLVKGTAAGKQLDGRVAAGKTGTTNASRSTWFTGYTPQLATSIWMGYPDEPDRELQRVNIAGKYHRNVYGGTIAAPMWKAYMDRALAGQPALSFVDPPQSMIGSVQAAPKPTAKPSRSSSPSSPRSEPSAPPAPEVPEAPVVTEPVVPAPEPTPAQPAPADPGADVAPPPAG